MAQRLAAIGAILAAAVVVVATIANALTDLRRPAVPIPLIIVAVVAAWYAITRTGGRRQLAIVVLAATGCGFVAMAIIDGARSAAIALARHLRSPQPSCSLGSRSVETFDHSSVRTRQEPRRLRPSTVCSS